MQAALQRHGYMKLRISRGPPGGGGPSVILTPGSRAVFIEEVLIFGIASFIPSENTIKLSKQCIERIPGYHLGSGKGVINERKTVLYPGHLLTECCQAKNEEMCSS